MHRVRRTALAALATLVALPALARAQGNLSTQGLGFPQGELSTRALSAGGALAETDPTTALNPAAILGFGATTLYFQYEPEYRTVTSGSVSAKTNNARYPLMVAGIPVGEKWMLSLSSSMFLDRTWATVRDTVEYVGPDTITSTNRFSSEGSISDLRLGAAYAPVEWFRLGVGLHGFSGSNRLATSRDFKDTTNFASFGDTTDLSYRGTGISAGAEVIIPQWVTIGVSARHGGTLKAAKNDSTYAMQGHIPDRFGASVAYIGVANTTLSFRTSYDKWSSLGALVSGPEQPKNSWDSSVGADVGGPRFGSSLIMMRAGLRWRTLPFPANGYDVKEKSVAFGLGTFLARGRASADFAAVRAMRDAGPVSERAWTFSVGLTIRP